MYVEMYIRIIRICTYLCIYMYVRAYTYIYVQLISCQNRLGGLAQALEEPGFAPGVEAKRRNEVQGCLSQKVQVPKQEVQYMRVYINM